MAPRSSTGSLACKTPAANLRPPPSGLRLQAPAHRRCREVVAPGADCSIWNTWPGGTGPPSYVGVLRPGAEARQHSPPRHTDSSFLFWLRGGHRSSGRPPYSDPNGPTSRHLANATPPGHGRRPPALGPGASQ
ncbi:hypothetical protein NDU88_002831 [Pleurodeles waltl]|uniref:Uncharacterized protein n=1 Tax=Pleurodeles waltl TaxID=8319 RepID=A0AAV7LGQ8_PLEWA|nr:hypothetical protein NDU88_002831 [Pleurodeles waltl]